MAVANLPAKAATRDSLAGMLKVMEPQLKAALPKHLTADRMIRLAMTAWSSTPKLQECTTTSIVGAVMQASQLGLEIDPVLGHGYLVPYKNKDKGCMEAKFISGYKGLCTLAARSGELEGAPEGGVVYEEDFFEYEFGLNPKLRIIPRGEDEDPKKITHAWALARFKGGAVVFKVMTRDAINKIRASSQGSNLGPWTDHYAEMAIKTVLRKLCKYLPLSPAIQRHIAGEELADAGRVEDWIDTAGGEIVDRPPVVEQQSEQPTFADKTEQQVKKKKATLKAEKPAAQEEQATEPPKTGTVIDPKEAIIKDIVAMSDDKTRQSILKHYQVDSLDDLSVSKASEALAILKQRALDAKKAAAAQPAEREPGDDE